jgi:hypothetical protein
MFAAACSGGTSADAGTSTTTATMSESTAGTTGPGVPDGWPERWFGRYYQVDENITVGVPSRSEPHFSTSLNIEFEPDRVVIEYFGHDNEPMGSVTTTPRFELGYVAIDPPFGAAYLDVPPAQEAKARAELRPAFDEGDTDCASMVLRIVYRPGPPDPPDAPDSTDLPIHRGRICLIEPLDDPDGLCSSVPIRPCEERPGCCTIIDHCPDDPTPTTCPTQ